MFKLVSLDNPRFRESIQINPKGSIFLGYLYVELVLAGVLDGEDLKIGMPDLQVKITVDKVSKPLQQPSTQRQQSQRSAL